MKIRKLAVATVVFSVACKPTPPAPPVPVEAIPVKASFGKTWDAVIDVFATQTIPIRTIERASGFIAAEQSRIPDNANNTDPHPWADCGKPIQNLIYFHPDAVFYNVRVKGDSTKSTVQVNADFKSANGPYRCSTKGVWEMEIEQMIKQKAEH